MLLKNSIRTYVDLRAIHPEWLENECWNCGHTWFTRHRPITCRECFMGQRQTDSGGEYTTPEGYTDYGRLWYGDVDDRAEYKRRYEENTEEVREQLKRRRAREREVNV